MEHTQSPLDLLATSVRGDVFTPDADGYNDARQLWNGIIDKKPAVIVRCTGVADVIAAVNYARENGLGVAIRSGGHHVAGGASIDDGLVIDLSGMQSVHVDPATRRVRVDGGTLLGKVDHETAAFGLAVPTGVYSQTGVGGISLGGGVGWLRRKVGYQADNIVSAEVVTADGSFLRASATENPDLYWALRGGGWDMGVVTSIEFQAHPMPNPVFVSFTAYAYDDAAAVLRGFNEYARTAPDAVSPICVLWTFPHEEPWPQEVWGQNFAAILAPYAGPVDEGEQATKPLRELATPLLDMSEPMPWKVVQTLFDADYPTGRRYYWKSTYTRELDDAAVDALVALGAERPSTLSSLDIWMLGGALSRVSATDTPIAHRDASFMMGIEANWDGPDGDRANIDWARGAVDRLAPFSTGGSYMNFEDANDAGATQASHGDANYRRLVALKKRYDPTNLFRSRRGLIG